MSCLRSLPLITLALALAVSAAAQQKPTKRTAAHRGQAANAQPGPAANPRDVDSIDHIMRALYDVISGPAGKQRDWNRMRSLFTKDNIMSAVVEGRTGGYRHPQFDADKYAKSGDGYFKTHGFFEREVSRRTEQFSHIVQVFSTYESRHELNDPKPFERGINSLQLLNDGQRWWILSILWQGESDKDRLPGKYLR